MQAKKIKNDTYDVSSLLNEVLGNEGTAQREENRTKAWEEYSAQILLGTIQNFV